MPKDQKEPEDLVKKRAAEISVQIRSLETPIVKSKVVIYCPECKQTSRGSRIDMFGNSMLGCPNWTSKARRVAPGDALIQLAEERAHEILREMPESSQLPFTFHCPIHDQEYTPIFEKKTIKNLPLECLVAWQLLVEEGIILMRLQFLKTIKYGEFLHKWRLGFKKLRDVLIHNVLELVEKKHLKHTTYSQQQPMKKLDLN